MADEIIRCLFYSEFDNIRGPIISFQSPERYISNEVFDSISDYVITKPQLSGRIITVNVASSKIMSCPTCIEDSRYHRNALIFAVGFSFTMDTDTKPFEPVLKKLASYLCNLEKESRFLFRSETKQKLFEILQKLRYGLNRSGECVVPIDAANTIRLKLIPLLPNPPEVKSHEVPVRIRNLDELVTRDWDLTLQQILPYIDGIRYVERIAKEADVEINLVKKCLQHLLYYQCVMMIDIFQYSNIYATLPDIGRFAENEELQQQCIQFITKKGFTPPSFPKVFTLYCSLRPSISMKEFCIQHDTHGLNIDDRHFVTFGLINKLIRRVHRYPMIIQKEYASISECERTIYGTKFRLNGFLTLDEICVQTSKSANEVLAVLSQDKTCTIINK